MHAREIHSDPRSCSLATKLRRMIEQPCTRRWRVVLATCRASTRAAVAALRRRSGRVALLAARSDHRRERAAARDRVGVEAQRERPAAVRHAARRVSEHAARHRRRDVLSTPYNQVAALDPTTGKELWRYDPKAYEDGQPPNGQGFAHRGVVAWKDGDRLRIFLNARYKLIQLDAKTGTPVVDVRHQRRRRSERRPGVGDQQEALHQHLAADRLQGSDHRRQRRRRSPHLQERSARRRARIQRADRKAGVEVQHHSAARRVRQQHLGRRLVAVHRPHQRLGADEPRRSARPALHAGQHAEQRLLRRPPARRRTCSPNRSSASMPTPASASGTTRSSITACGTTIRRRRRISSPSPSTASASTPSCS